MDFDGFSSPLGMPSPLPPSDAPDAPTPDDSTPHRTAVNPLSLEEAEQQNEEAAGANRRRRRPRTQPGGEVPLVRDVVGESVAESFETFLKTYVLP